MNILKKLIFVVPILLLILSSCIDRNKDLYDPNYETDNPIDIVAPNSFNAQNLSGLKLNITPNDEYDNLYLYKISIYDRNPLLKGANKLNEGVASGNKPFECSIDYLNNTPYLFIKQTDPRGRELIAAIKIEEGDKDATLNFSFKDKGQKASTKAHTRDELARPEYHIYTPADIPDDAIEITSSTLIESNKSYVISGNYTGTFKHTGTSDAKLFVLGTWAFNRLQVERGLSIIALEGSKIDATNLHLIGNSSLEIMPNAEVNFDNLEFSNKNRLINLGKLNLNSISNNPGIFYNGEEGEIEVKTNLSIGGGNYYNDGIINAKAISTEWGTNLVNNCQINVERTFLFKNGSLILNKGAVIARNMEFNNNIIELNNGSMLKATEKLNANSIVDFICFDLDTPSLIKSPIIDFVTMIEYNGNIVVECDTHPTMDWGRYLMINGATMTTYDGSNVTITTCAGEVNTPTGGDTPHDPDDIIISNDYIYSYAYEDEWPIYGDYDMNDLVVKITDMSLTKSNKKGLEYIDNLTFTTHFMAIGATRTLSLALQLDDIDKNDIDKVEFINDGGELLSPAQLNINQFNVGGDRLEEGQTYAVIPLAYNVHSVLGFKNEQVNTNRNGARFSSDKKFKLRITFKEKALTDFSLKNNFNLFIITNNNIGQDRREIHLINYPPTELDSTFDFDKNNDRSITNDAYYTSEDHLGWAILTAEKKEEAAWKWPIEFVKITEAYPEFSEWVLSGQTEANEWYKNSIEKYVY